MSEDFWMGAQRFSFVRREKRRSRYFDVFEYECTICRTKATVALKRGVTTSPRRRCGEHAMRRVWLGSRREALVIEAFGWTVAEGSVLDLMRQEGSAYRLTKVEGVEAVVPWTASAASYSGVTPLPEAKAEALTPYATPQQRQILAAIIRQGGHAKANDLAVLCGVRPSTIRVQVMRMQEKHLVFGKGGAWTITERGRDALDANQKPQVTPRLVSTALESDEPVMSLFD